MIEDQLKALIGCVLIYKVSEYIIQSVDIQSKSICFTNDGFFVKNSIQDFVTYTLPYLKAYLTEDDNSLVSIKQYLEHYDLK